MSPQRFLAFDLGAESGRAVLGTLNSGRLSLNVQHRFANPTGKIRGQLQWNLLAQWEELKTGLRKAAAAGGGRIDGIGVDTWGLDFGFIGADGHVLANPVMYRDSRTDGMMARTFQNVAKEKIFRATGVQFMQINTLFQLMAMRLSDSPLLNSAHTLLMMPDLFHYLFSGIRMGERSIASTSQIFDPRAMDWAWPLLKELDLPTKLLPPLMPGGSVLGPLLPEVAAECGVEPMPVIAPASHDTASAIAAVPAFGNDWCYISSGTWSIMGAERAEPIITDQTLAHNFTNEIGLANKICFLKNTMGMWLIQECRRHWQSQGTDHDYAKLTSMAAQCPGLGALIDPDFSPFLSPGNIPAKIEEFCGKTRQNPPANPAEFVRACLDSLALTYRHHLESLELLTGRKINVIHIVGGGSQNQLLNQMTADACDRVVLAGPVEATAAGNILAQAMATGNLKSLDEIRQVVRNSFQVQRYEPTDIKKWDAAYARYVEILAPS